LSTKKPTFKRPILLTGATGYIGGRLLKSLEASGRALRCMTLEPEFLRPKVRPSTEVVRGDVRELSTLDPALEGVEIAYYLVHSLTSGGGSEEEDRRGAAAFAQAARRQGIRRIIYLSGLGRPATSREAPPDSEDIGQILRDSGVPTIEFTASMIIGSGSLSFELVRGNVEKLPIMIAPHWVRNRVRPIAVEDVVAYLMAALDLDIEGSAVFEIGGADAASYADIIREYSHQRGLKRLTIPLPFSLPWLSSYWLGLVTSLYPPVGRRLIASVLKEHTDIDEATLRTFKIQPRGVKETVSRALENEEEDIARTRWSDALVAHRQSTRWGGERHGSRLVDSQSIHVAVPPAKAFQPLRRIGGDTGWYYAGWLWHIRGWLDLLVGGVGMRRGRRLPDELIPGEVVDFWRVEAYEEGRLIRLRAEMKVPGRAWLQFEVDGEDSEATIRQTAIFDTVGLPGLAYWYVLYPIHKVIFKGLLRKISAAAEKDSLSSQDSAPKHAPAS